jgi:hypothetical protein
MNRRSFLKVTAGTAATVAFLPPAHCAAARRNLRKAIMYSTIGMKGTVLEKFRAMKDAGFEGVEPMGGMDRDEYLDAINSEWVGWHFDVGNAGRVGPAERWIQVIGKRILRIHVKDYSAKPADPAARGERPKLLEGDTNWPAVMKALDHAGYTGWAIWQSAVEAPHPGPLPSAERERADFVFRRPKLAIFVGGLPIQRLRQSRTPIRVGNGLRGLVKGRDAEANVALVRPCSSDR